MQIIGFNFTKIQAERKMQLDSNLNINTNIEFTNLEKEKVELLQKDKESIRLSFKFSIMYQKGDKKDNSEANVTFEGFMLLAAEIEESKDLLKEWKKKQVPQNLRLPFFNSILKRCSVKALQLEDELGLPNHMPIPQIAPQPQQAPAQK